MVMITIHREPIAEITQVSRTRVGHFIEFVEFVPRKQTPIVHGPRDNRNSRVRHCFALLCLRQFVL